MAKKMQSMNEVEIKDYSEEWYTMGRSFLPPFESEQFARLAGQAQAFVHKVAGATDTSLTVKAADTAYVNLETNEIVIPSKYFSSEFYTKRFENGDEKTENLAIALVNGSVIHEALHVAHTNAKDIQKALMLDSRYYTFKKIFGLSVMAPAFNIMEDIYIEARVPEVLATFLQATSDIIFTEEGLSKIGSISDLTNYLNLACYYKNKGLRDNEAFGQFSVEQIQILERLGKGLKMDKIEARVAMTYNFLQLWLDQKETEEDDSSDDNSEESESGQGGSESGESESGESDDSEPSNEYEAEFGKMGGSKELGELLDKIDELDEETIEAIAKEVAEAVAEEQEDWKPKKVWDDEHGSCWWNRPVVLDVMDMKALGNKVNPVKANNYDFIKDLAAMRTINRNPGRARNYGSTMVKSRLTRIATDGKIFAKNDSHRNTLKRIEVIISIDMSGSTLGRVQNEEMGAAMAMSKALRQARIAHSVYGHTATMKDEPLIVHIFSYDMHETNQNWETRFEEACRRVDFMNNYDGAVMEVLADKFTEKPGQKFLINLSDGTPCGAGYYSVTANNHTSAMAQTLRGRGVMVFSVSVVRAVVESNDKIYGKEFNLDASKGNARQQMEKLMMKLLG
jgi:hypothetical protein